MSSLNTMTPTQAGEALDRIIKRVAAKRNISYMQAARVVAQKTQAFQNYRAIQERDRQDYKAKWQDPRIAQFQELIREKYENGSRMSANIPFVMDFIEIVDELGGTNKYDPAALLYAQGKYRTLLSWVAAKYHPDDLKTIRERYQERYGKDE